MAGTITHDRARTTDGQRGGPLIVTEDPPLLDDLLRLCAAAGARPEVHHGVPERGGGWEAAPLVLVGDDAAPRVRGATRRRGVVLVGRDQDDPGVWRRAVEIGADHVLVLPDGEQWLVDRIADVAEGVGRPAFTVGVIGGRGGAGASTLACALAVTSARAGRRTLLVDADPLGGGLDVLLGGETADGLRWPAFAESRGRVGGGALEEALPELHALRVLSWDRGDSVAVPPQAMRAVLAAARRRGGVVVVDLPRRVDESSAEALAQLDLGLLVVPAELRAVAAASRVASAVGMVLPDLRAVVGGPRGGAAASRTGGLSGTREGLGGLDAEEVARLLGLPLAGELPVEDDLLNAQDDGRPPGGDPRGPLARFCGAFWERMPVEGGAS
ncbi:septum site-determining protein Ssd [Streptomyces sp. NPDC058001]|uniref:septum site-determining protein Ssd n=1 Tax=Streptomyces sp. NPDC058001 TaxID=3346300 RepID=UPI0036EE562A